MGVETMLTNQFRLSLDLQYFAEEGGNVFQGGYNPEPREPVVNPLIEEPPAIEPQIEPPGEPEIFDFGGRKVNPGDINSLKGLHDDWNNSQRYIQQLQQERQQLMQYQQTLLQQQVAPPVQEPVVPETQFDMEAFMDKFYEDPKQALDMYVNTALEQRFAQIESRFEQADKSNRYQTEVQEVSSKFQDFNDFVPQMQEIIEGMGDEKAEQFGLENIYYMAKGRSTPNPQNLLNDPNYITQHVMNNEQLRNTLLTQLMQNKQQSQPQAPVMGGNQGGQQPFAQQVRPRSVEEATRLARQYYGF